MRTVPATLAPLALLLSLTALPGRAEARDVEAGPIWNNADANNKCPRVCQPPTKWGGQWRTTVPNRMSVCGCDEPPPPPQDAAVDKEAGPIWNNADANNKCPRVCAGGQWNGQWRTTVPNRMSVCGCVMAAAPPPPPPPPAVLFEHVGFQGAQLPVGSDLPDLRAPNLGFNDRVSSLRLAPGMVASLYEHVGFQGRCLTVGSDLPDLRAPNLNFNDVASSIRLGQPCPAAAPPADPAAAIVGVYAVAHRHWSGSITIRPDGTYQRDAAGDRGRWSFDGRALVLRWDNWPPETLEPTAPGQFVCRAYPFTMNKR